jgi:alkylation response protein AidB-like acyl-CoA dehydrogenase
VTGLRGTGSDAFTATDLFVPHAHTVSRDDPAERRHPGPLYCFPSGSLYAAGFSGVAMGLARSSLDAFIELARDKEPRSSKRPVRDSALIQFQVAEAEARLGAARVFLHDALQRIWADVSRSGLPLGVEQRVAIRLASTYGIHQAKQVVDTVHHAAGVDRHLHQHRVRTALPGHPHRDPAAPGPSGPSRDRRPLPPRPRARPDLFIGRGSWSRWSGRPAQPPQN